MVRGIDDPLRVLTVCGVGMGSSLILKMTAQRAFERLGVKARVEHTDLPGLRGTTPDVIIAQPLHASEVRGLAPIVVEVTNFLDEEALMSALAPRLREAGWLPDDR
jgi:PTS system ascorbate-specific IIB component